MNERHTRTDADPESEKSDAQAAPRVWVARGLDDIVTALRAAAGLLDRTVAPFCARPMWLSTWYAHSTAQPLAVVVEQRGEITGLACLAIHRAGPLRTITLAGDGPSDYGRLPARDEPAARALADGILGVLADTRRPWRLRLAQLPTADPVAGALCDALAGARLAAGQACPAMTFGPERVPERLISAKARRATRRGWTRLEEAGVKVSVDRISEPDQVHDLLPDIVALHRDRDHVLGRRSDLDGVSRRSFYIEVVRGLAEAGQLDLWVLRLDGALGAFVVGVRDGSAYHALDARIGDLWTSASPGQLLRTEMITALLAEPELVEFDWMRGELRNKLQHATHVVATEALLAESSPLVSAALDRWQSLRQEVRERIPGQARRWLRSRTAVISAPGSRFRAERAAPDAGRAGPRRPGAAGGNREPS